jgi:cobalamin-dependent methionine synthase I
MLKKVFQPCSHALVFIATLGSGVDGLLAGTEEARVSEAFVLDAIASRVAEGVADEVERKLTGALATQEGATLRYSPGYCDWPVDGQRMVFSILDGSRIGVSLTGHCLMQPRKSLSGIIGVGPSDQVVRTGNACNFCKRTDCDHRRGEMQ